MPHGASQGAAAANDLAEQKERSTVQMKNRSKVPQSKSKSQFTGYAGDSPLQTSESKQQAQRVVPGQKGPKGPPLHPWLEYPPNFERAVARKVVVSAQAKKKKRERRFLSPPTPHPSDRNIRESVHRNATLARDAGREGWGKNKKPPEPSSWRGDKPLVAKKNHKRKKIRVYTNPLSRTPPTKHTPHAPTTSSSQFLKRVPAKLLDPLPAELRYTLSRNFGFFTSVFTQFFDKSGVSNVQNSLGLGK